ncbi:hypothetical protein B0H10DRAFT_1967703 [Mycena sp. CBHHK59/15]|nr:hypothetical protein B0H10DRAFT_1967703 [Mycena sp. CBHHK59/15]
MDPDSLVDYSKAGSYSSRSSTPVQEPYHSTPIYMAHSGTVQRQQPLEDWATLSSSPTELFAPHPLCFNSHQNTPSVPIKFRQCNIWRRENLILGAENNTLKCVIMLVPHACGQAGNTSHPGCRPFHRSTWGTLGALQTRPRAVRLPGRSLLEFPRVQGAFKSTKGESNMDEPKPHGASRAAQGINVAMLYVTDAQGDVIDGYRATEIQGLATRLFGQMVHSGIAPATWKQGTLDLHWNFSDETHKHYPEMALCLNDWKVQHMATKMYSGWYRGSSNSQAIKVEGSDDHITQAKRTKRSHCGDSSTNKHMKMETCTIPSPPEHDEQNDHSTKFFAVVAPPAPSALVASVPAPIPAPIPTQTTENLDATLLVSDEIVNPLLPTMVPTALFQIINLLQVLYRLSTPLSPLPSFAPTTSGEEVPLPAVVAPVVTGPVITTPVTITLATNIPVIIAAETKKETKAAPSPSITARNLCMIDWCKDHPSGYLSVFKLHWDIIEKSAEKLEELVQIGTCHAGVSYKRSMGMHSKVRKTWAANLLQNLSNTTKHAWDELSPKKLQKWLSPRKRHKENVTDNTEIERSVTGDTSDDPFHMSDASNDPFHATDASNPFAVSMQSFHVPGFTESASAAPAAHEFIWKLPKPTVEEVDDEDDRQSTNTFPPPAQPCPLLASLAENCTDDPRDLIDVPEADDELLATSPAHDDDYLRLYAPRDAP